MSQTDSVGKALGRSVIYIIVTVIILAVIRWLFTSGVEILAEKSRYEGILTFKDYAVYLYIIVLFVLGRMIVNAVASMFYSMMTPKYGASTGAAVRSLIRILGLGAL
jgi:small conductance mechanosensitive channel